MKKLLLIITVIAVFPALSMAACPPNPGQYDLSGIQQVCLVNDGTWYGTTFPAWSGHYDMVDGDLHMYGNYDNGDGNDEFGRVPDSYYLNLYVHF